MRMFILVNDLSSPSQPNYIWYLRDLCIYHNLKSDWLLQPTQSLKKKNAMRFCESKAKQVAEILSNQVDEVGYSSRWVVEQAEVLV